MSEVGSLPSIMSYTRRRLESTLTGHYDRMVKQLTILLTWWEGRYTVTNAEGMEGAPLFEREPKKTLQMVVRPIENWFKSLWGRANLLLGWGRQSALLSQTFGDWRYGTHCYSHYGGEGLLPVRKSEPARPVRVHTVYQHYNDSCKCHSQAWATNQGA